MAETPSGPDNYGLQPYPQSAPPPYAQPGFPPPQYPHPYPAQGYYYPVPVPVPVLMPIQMRNGYGVAALVLGLVAWVFGVATQGIPLFGLISLVGAILAVVFGGVGQSLVNKRQASNGNMATAGLVLGVVYFAFGLIGMVTLMIAFAS